MKKVVVFCLLALVPFYVFSVDVKELISGKWAISNVHHVVFGTNDIVRDMRNYSEWLIEFRNDGSGYVKAKESIQEFKWSEKDQKIVVVYPGKSIDVYIDEIKKDLLIMFDKQEEMINIGVLTKK